MDKEIQKKGKRMPYQKHKTFSPDEDQHIKKLMINRPYWLTWKKVGEVIAEETASPITGLQCYYRWRDHLSTRTSSNFLYEEENLRQKESQDIKMMHLFQKYDGDIFTLIDQQLKHYSIKSKIYMYGMAKSLITLGIKYLAICCNETHFQPKLPETPFIIRSKEMDRIFAALVAEKFRFCPKMKRLRTRIIYILKQLAKKPNYLSEKLYSKDGSTNDKNIQISMVVELKLYEIEEIYNLIVYARRQQIIQTYGSQRKDQQGDQQALDYTKFRSITTPYPMLNLPSSSLRTPVTKFVSYESLNRTYQKQQLIKSEKMLLCQQFAKAGTNYPLLFKSFKKQLRNMGQQMIMLRNSMLQKLNLNFVETQLLQLFMNGIIQFKKLVYDRRSDVMDVLQRYGRNLQDIVDVIVKNSENARKLLEFKSDNQQDTKMQNEKQFDTSSLQFELKLKILQFNFVKILSNSTLKSILHFLNQFYLIQGKNLTNEQQNGVTNMKQDIITAERQFFNNGMKNTEIMTIFKKKRGKRGRKKIIYKDSQQDQKEQIKKQIEKYSYGDEMSNEQAKFQNDKYLQIEQGKVDMIGNKAKIIPYRSRKLYNQEEEHQIFEESGSM